MTLHFSKMHGLGNDYVFISTLDQTVPDAPALARSISNRHLGVGGDGLILIRPPEGDDAHARMEMYNADGSRAEMCGNGIRCVAKYVYERWLPKTRTLHIETDAGVRAVEVRLAGNVVHAVRVDMGTPVLAAERMPANVTDERIVDVAMSVGDTVLPLTCVSMGNPHAVMFVEAVDAVPLAEWGPLVERHTWFPQRINAHFVERLDNNRVRARTWERGSGATRACGTGACAVCVAGALTGRTERTMVAELPGGTLEIEWDEQTDQVFMTGPATHVFDGEWPL